jgi:hypothetical protein
MKILDVNQLQPQTEAERRVVRTLRDVAASEADRSCVDTFHEWHDLLDEYLQPLPGGRETLERMLGHALPKRPDEDEIPNVLAALADAKQASDLATARFDSARVDNQVSDEEMNTLARAREVTLTSLVRASRNVQFFWKSMSAAERQRFATILRGAPQESDRATSAAPDANIR